MMNFGAVCVMFSLYLFIAAGVLCLIQAKMRKKRVIEKIYVPNMPYTGVPCGIKQCM